jgi:hypothetical protein
MDQRVEKVVKAFANNGWNLAGSVDISQEWWFDDIILLESIRSPVGKKLYMTLLTDPMERKKKKVWAISLSTILPEQKNYESLSQITLNDVKKQT